MRSRRRSIANATTRRARSLRFRNRRRRGGATPASSTSRRYRSGRSPTSAVRPRTRWSITCPSTISSFRVTDTMSLQPTPADKFTFGLWTVGNRGRDPFGDFVRPALDPCEAVRRLADLGASGVNFHDNDLVPIDATSADRDRIVGEFRRTLESTGMTVPMATTNLFTDPVFKDGAFTAHDPRIRAYALQKTMSAMDLGVELGARTYVFWGGREGAEVDAAKDPVEAIKRFRGAIDFLCEYARDQRYDLRFALEAKPNEPRGDIYFPTTASYLGFIGTLAHPDMVGVNPEFAHEQMIGLNFFHVVAQALEAGKLFHIYLNDQKTGRFDQDLRLESESIKPLYFLGKLLEV